MPRSIVIYTSPGAYLELTRRIHTGFETFAVKPCTVSLPQKADGGRVRCRITELADGAATPLVEEMVRSGEATAVSGADRDVKGATYGELLDDADRFGLEAHVQFVSPVIIEIEGGTTPFPVVSAVFQRYIAVWNCFSAAKIAAGALPVECIHVKDFKISCVGSGFGKGAQGWMTLEMEKGRTEEEIGLFNGLIDYAFFSGTGMYTDVGLGQTRRLPGKGRM
jgi:CRISPR/Cas system endoribonuclease Cas6 (RAMP superfamily)